MKASRLTKIGAAAIAMAALSLAFADRLLPGQPGTQAALSAEKTARASGMAMVPLGLPSEDTAKALLDSSIANHHPQWIDVPMGRPRSTRLSSIRPCLERRRRSWLRCAMRGSATGRAQ